MPVDGETWQLELAGRIENKRPWTVREIYALPEQELIIMRSSPRNTPKSRSPTHSDSRYVYERRRNWVSRMRNGLFPWKSLTTFLGLITARKVSKLVQR
jgi:hypothetical protein